MTPKALNSKAQGRGTLGIRNRDANKPRRV